VIMTAVSPGYPGRACGRRPGKPPAARPRQARDASDRGNPGSRPARHLRPPPRRRHDRRARRARAAPGLKRTSPGQAKPEEIHAIRLAREDTGTTAA
jgi:hypothetical protein